ncbi:MAG: type II secretion system F family protein [Steroidobacteraceae bacterium]
MPLLPRRLNSVWTVRLRQAELEQQVSVQQWLGVRALYGLALGSCTWLALTPLSSGDAVLTAAVVAIAFVLPGLWLHDLVASRRASLLRDLPAYLDLLTLAVESGGSLTSAMRIAVEKAPPSILRRMFERVLSDVRSGRSRRDALASAAAHYDMTSLTTVTNALIQAENSGMSLGSILRAQTEQRLNERFAAAEKLAMQAPVKMLGPLILCIFPCTFIVIGFPIVVRLMGDLNA